MRKLTGKVFGIGLSKTGTTSLFYALHLLGIRSGTHRHIGRLGLEEWFRGNYERDYFAEYDALTDTPLPVLFPALDERYPKSIFVLTVRDQESWLESCERHWARWGSINNDFGHLADLITYGTTGFQPALFLHKYKSHEENVKNYFAERPQDLLVLNVIEGEGWEILCPFLGLDIPDIPFPNVQPGFIPPGMSD